MKKTLLFAVLILALPAFAKWAHVPTETLTQQSDLVVVGSLTEVKEWTAAEVDHGEGTIVVEDVLHGAAKVGDKLHLIWQNDSGIACPRVEWKQAEKQQGIWLLTRDKQDVRADHPGRFVRVEAKADVIKALKARR